MAHADLLAAEFRAFYGEANVRRRIVEFLGGDSLQRATCRFISAGDTMESCGCLQPRPTKDLLSCLSEGRELCRSLWDKESLVVDFDMEYVNFDCPTEPWLEPERAFQLQLPVERAARALLLSFGIVPLRMQSGRGYHFLWRVDRDRNVFRKLGVLARGPASLWRLNGQPHPPSGESVPPDLGAAFAGLGLVMEFFAHRLKEVAAPHCEIPVELTAVEVGPAGRGREMISLDISEYGDPLHTRTVRTPFSAYLKPWQMGRSQPAQPDLLPRVVIPIHGFTTEEGVRIMRHPREAIDLAASTQTTIPDQSGGMDKMVEAYLQSDEAAFHTRFYAEEHDPPERWAESYDRTLVEALPVCVRLVLTKPNDLLLRPACVRLVTRALMAQGWHPRHIAGLIRSKFERDHGWGERWNQFDAAARADFYVRLFAGPSATGRDDLLDFNCVSVKEAQLCPGGWCANNLADLRQSLLSRIDL